MSIASRSRLQARLSDALGAGAVLTEPEDLAVYAFDAGCEARMPPPHHGVAEAPWMPWN